MLWTVIFIFVLAVLLYVRQKFSNKRRNDLGDKIPGPKPIPFIGNALYFINNKDPIEVLSALSEQYGTIYRAYLGSDLYVMLSDPSDIEVIMSSSKHISKASSYSYTRQWLGYGLITAEGKQWHKHRKLLTHTFHFKILEQSTNTIYNHAKILVEQLRKEVGRGEFNIFSYIERCTMDMICETAMGIKLNTQTSADTSYMDAVKNVTEISCSRIFKLWLQPDILFRLSNCYGIYKKGIDIMENTSRTVINKRRKELVENINIANSETKTEKKMPFLDMLLLESDFTDEEINDEVRSFMFAGHDTTTSGISFGIQNLALHQDIQDKIYEEILQVIPNKDICPTIPELSNLKYLDAVIREMLRLCPPVPMIGRELHEDVVLPSGYTLPSGCQVNINIYGLHHNSNIYKNPERFDVERFTNKDAIKHPFGYIPFSGGPRNCIGQRYAMIKLKLVLSSIIREYRILPTDRTSRLTLSSRLVLSSLQGIPVMLEHRTM